MAVILLLLAILQLNVNSLHYNNNNLFIKNNLKSTRLLLSESDVSYQNKNNDNNNRYSTKNSYSTRVLKLKNLVLEKDILKHITAAEFALKVEKDNDNNNIIDYDKLISDLSNDIIKLNNNNEYSNTNKDNFIARINNILNELIQYSSNINNSNKNNDTIVDNSNNDKSNFFNINKKIYPVKSSNSDNSNSDNIVQEIKDNLRILIREDGTVDWDGAIASGREVAKFGTELWERLNGKEKEEGLPSLKELFSQMQSPSPSSPTITKLANIIANCEVNIKNIMVEREQLQLNLRKKRRKGKQVSRLDLQALRKLDSKLKELEKILKIVVIDYDMEKICTYLIVELEDASLDQIIEQRSIVAQVTLIDKQLKSLLITTQSSYDNSSNGNGNTVLPDSEIIPTDITKTLLKETDASIISSDSLSDDLMTGNGLSDIIALIDEEELTVIQSEINDVKNRLGLDTQFIPEFDWGSVGKFSGETLNKIRVGLSYFGEGSGLLVSDIQYGWTMLLKAAQGYTLKPREVNAIRRTAKDIFTLVPFTIILLIPLSPVGHVLVFAFIQKYFPEFYPSCYTDKRLNLKRLFAEVERTYNEDLLLGKESTSESIESAVMSLVEPVQQWYTNIGNSLKNTLSNYINNNNSDDS